MTLIATKLSLIKPSPTLMVTNKANSLRKSGHDIISLGAGEPDFDTPDNIKKAAIKAINEGQTKYTAVDGTNELKEAVRKKFLRENNINYEISQITISNGAKQVIYNALAATINNNDEVIIPSPYWVSYPDMVSLVGGKPIIVEGQKSNKFKVTAEIIEKLINTNTKWIIINSPSNPTGSSYSYDEIKEIADMLLKYPNINILSDDIYEHIIYDDIKFHTIAAVEPRLINRILTVNGVSKSYSMTGWRIGYAGGNRELIEAMSVIQSQTTSNPCSISQAAAIEALNCNQDFIKDNNLNFKLKRDLVVRLINQIDLLNCEAPAGAFYIFINCQKMFGKKFSEDRLINDSNDVADYLLEKAKVAVVQGTAFGMDGYFRISYAINIDKLEEAIRRISLACEELN